MPESYRTLTPSLNLRGANEALAFYIKVFGAFGRFLRPDWDANTRQAFSAGAELLHPPTNHTWGERSAMVKDPFNLRWAICTHVEDVSPEEIQRRLATWNPQTNEW